ncbi:hypothetical protein BIZ78_gp160 [Erwinia phage vB_EamM_Caitlin]|uniref:hypothetical protein n=1 Tax=Erwinia phage vB_EamM_Caitlin TaxID=1883379 RepID=UPI00081CEA5D|nr:hypothetical protein BIZ78_gp160 [Erwinia phage vB_EamM_Caitlin]ANZ48415.1 hypothetical protein CAITLIN_120 [Erwinia phage vB_EamM_Caitlin]
MSINRSVSRSKEVVYTVETGDEMEKFHGVIDENHVLLVAYPGKEMTNRRHTSLLEKLVAKAANRDGIKSHDVLYGKVLNEDGKELVIHNA